MHSAWCLSLPQYHRATVGCSEAALLMVLQYPGLLLGNRICLIQPSEKILLTWASMNSSWNCVLHSFTRLYQQPGHMWKGSPTAMDLLCLLLPIPRSVNHICHLLLTFLLPEKEITKKINKSSSPPWILFKELIHEVGQARTKLLLKFFFLILLFLSILHSYLS